MNLDTSAMLETLLANAPLVVLILWRLERRIRRLEVITEELCNDVVDLREDVISLRPPEGP